MTADLTPGSGMRASDHDRDAAARRLSVALSEGRLDLEEYERRLDSVMSATTFGDLAPPTSDLPEPAERPSSDGAVDLAEVAGQTGGAVAPWREWFDEWRDWAGGAVIMIGIWTVTSVVSGEALPFWPAIPLGIWAVILVASLVWPGSDNGRGGSRKRRRQQRTRGDGPRR